MLSAPPGCYPLSTQLERLLTPMRSVPAAPVSLEHTLLTRCLGNHIRRTHFPHQSHSPLGACGTYTFPLPLLTQSLQPDLLVKSWKVRMSSVPPHGILSIVTLSAPGLCLQVACAFCLLAELQTSKPSWVDFAVRTALQCDTFRSAIGRTGRPPVPRAQVAASKPRKARLV